MREGRKKEEREKEGRRREEHLLTEGQVPGRLVLSLTLHDPLPKMSGWDVFRCKESISCLGSLKTT